MADGLARTRSCRRLRGAACAQDRQPQGDRRCPCRAPARAANACHRRPWSAHLAQCHHFALLIGDLEPHDILARDHFHHAHTQDRQRPRQILGKARDLARFSRPAQERSSKRVTTGPGCTATTSASIPEILELHFHESRERFERLCGIRSLDRQRIIQELPMPAAHWRRAAQKQKRLAFPSPRAHSWARPVTAYRCARDPRG